MAELTLVIGNKNYSSWSLRPWIALKQAGAAFREIRIPFTGIRLGTARRERVATASGER